MANKSPIMFVDRKSGEALNGKLMPAAEAQLEEMTAALRLHMATMTAEDFAAWWDLAEGLRQQMAALPEGQWFDAKIGREQASRDCPRGKFTKKSVAIRPPQIHPVRG